jgi:polyferredoxin
MTPNRKSAVVCALIVLFYSGLAGVFLLAMPQPRQAIHYMVAGAFATGVSLLVAFVLYAFGRINPEFLLRTVRRSAQSS